MGTSPTTNEVSWNAYTMWYRLSQIFFITQYKPCYLIEEVRRYDSVIMALANPK
jgi:hypothetical protein